MARVEDNAVPGASWIMTMVMGYKDELLQMQGEASANFDL